MRAHAIDAATFSSTRIFQALIFICVQARKEDRQSPPAAARQTPARPLPALRLQQVGRGSAELPENLPPGP